MTAARDLSLGADAATQGPCPALPLDMGHAGKNVWAWADAMSRHTQMLHRRRELSASIVNAGLRCGSCAHWMTKACPREKSSMTGYSQGPSAGAVKCGTFIMKASTTKLVADWQAELATLGDGAASRPLADDGLTSGRDQNPSTPPEEKQP